MGTNLGLARVHVCSNVVGSKPMGQHAFKALELRISPASYPLMRELSEFFVGLLVGSPGFAVACAADT
jgi:hypothetical protein